LNEAIASGKVRFVVSDLRRVAAEFPPDKKLQMHERGRDGDLLPPVVPASSRAVFPMTQPAVFRSVGRGRYVVHVLKDLEVNTGNGKRHSDQCISSSGSEIPVPVTRSGGPPPG
jgi:hypothetical protein